MCDAKLYSKCGHLVPKKYLKVGGLYSWKAEFDYCPDCVEEITKKQDELQETFGETFGGGSESPTEGA